LKCIVPAARMPPISAWPCTMRITAAALTDCADNALGLRRIELTVFADNAPAIALYRKSGFAEEGRSRAYAMRDGVLADALHMARIVDAPRFETI
jgi:putative acetyltransferase